MLPPNLKAILRGQRMASHDQHMTEVMSNIGSANNIARHAAARQVDEPGPAESRAVAKVLSLP